MFGQFFNIEESVFSIAPDPKYLYLSRQHEEALAHLVYGVTRKGGFVCLTGDIGTGKTTICRCMFEQLPDKTDIAFVINPKYSALELLASICDELKISYSYFQPNLKEYTKKLYKYLIDAHAKGRNTVLVIDEAQNLSADTLEHVRSLTNVETNEEKLLQIILIGQPELRDLLAKPELEQVNQRITARFHIGSLNLYETNQYIKHRLTIAGSSQPIFTKSNIRQIHRLSRGVPRLINILCDRVLLGAYTLGQRKITSSIIKKSADEVFDRRKDESNFFPKTIAASLFALLISGAVVFAYQSTKLNFIEIHKPSDPIENTELDEKLIDEDALAQHIQKEEPIVDYEHNNEQYENEIKQVSEKSDSNDIELSEVHEINVQTTNLSKRELAFQEVFRLWGIEYLNSGNKPCEHAIIHNLNCYQARGDITSLKNLNRPSVLKSNLTHYEPSYIALVSIEDDKAIVSEKGNFKLIDLSEIETNWSSEYEILWRPIESGITYINPGTKGKAVQTLDVQLAKIMGHKPLLLNPFIYSEHLERHVKEFQISKNITVDAIVGPITQIHINNALGLDVPLLSKIE